MIYIVAGHTGKGSGASSSYLDEGIETIVLRNLICLNLTRLNFLDFETDDDKDSLQTVLNKLKDKVKKEDIVLDIHFNAAADPKATGSEVFIPTDYSPEEKELAEKLLNEVTTTLGIRSRGVKTEGQSQHNRLGILHLPCTTLLVEICFLTNKGDVYKYKKNREKLAERIAQVLLNNIFL